MPNPTRPLLSRLQAIENIPPATKLRSTQVLLHPRRPTTRTLLRSLTDLRRVPPRTPNRSHHRSFIYHQKKFKRPDCRRRSENWTKLQRRSEEKRNGLPSHPRMRPSTFLPPHRPSGPTPKQHRTRNTIRPIPALTRRLTGSTTTSRCQTTMSSTPPRSKSRMTTSVLCTNE